MADTMTLHMFTGCPFSLMCMMTARALNIPVKLQMYTERSQLQSEEFLAISPSGSQPALETSEGVITNSETICRYLCGSKAYLNLGGQSAFDKAQVDMWMATMRDQLAGVLELRRIQIGCGAWTQEHFYKSKNQLMKNLVRFEEHLALRTYFVSHSITLADIIFTSILAANRTIVLEQNDLKAFPNISRHLTSIMSTSFWTKVMGRSFCPSTKAFGKPNSDDVKALGGVELCPHAGGKQAAKPVAGKKGGDNKNQAKGGKKGNQSPTKKAAPKKEVADDEEPPKPKKVELSPEEAAIQLKATVWFNDWKTFFANSKDKTEACERLFKEIDYEQFSVWHCLYDKTPTELKDECRSANMLTFFFRGMEGFNKDCCAVHGLYGTEPNLNLKGIWLMRSKDMHEKVSLQSNYEYYIWTRMDLNKPEDQARLKHYWLNNDEDVSVVEGEVARRCKIFK